MIKVKGKQCQGSGTIKKQNPAPETKMGNNSVKLQIDRLRSVRQPSEQLFFAKVGQSATLI